MAKLVNNWIELVLFKYKFYTIVEILYNCAILKYMVKLVHNWQLAAIIGGGGEKFSRVYVNFKFNMCVVGVIFFW